MNYVITESTSDTFTLWDGRTFHPDFARKPMGEMIFLNQLGHEFQKGDIVQLTIRFIAHAPSKDESEIEKRLAEGAGLRASDQQ